MPPFVVRLQSNKYRQHQEGDGQNHQEQLEQNGLFKPLCKADVGKSETYKKRAAGGIEHVCVSVGKQIGQDDDRLADALDGRECQHGNNEDRLCGCARDKEFDNQYEHVQNNDRKVGRDVGYGVVEIVEDGM